MAAMATPFRASSPRLPLPISSISPPRGCSWRRKKTTVRAMQGGEKSEKRSFLTVEEAGLVDISGLAPHEKFLCRLTISSLNLLRVISEEEGVKIEELNAGRVCDWFFKDKLKGEQDPESAVLQWGDSGFGL
ncbi:receptor-interacting protein [Wolffia australiana]